MERKNYIIAIDLGSSNVTVAIGEKNADEKLHIVSLVQKKARGMKAGQIENIELVGQSIRDAVSEVEKELGIRITEAYAGISGEFVRCARHTDHVFVSDSQNGVSHNDVVALFDRMRNVQAPEGEIIMERVPQNYIVDDSQEVENPEGSFGRKLSSTFNFILCHQTPMQRLKLAMKRMNIEILSVLPNALFTPEAVLLPDEKEEGVAVVNVGAGVTDVTVYYRNVVRYVATIPMGASAINRDIRTMGVPEKYVESLKQKYGSAVAELAPDDKLIRVNGRTSREAKDILLRNLATVIEARGTDIAEYVLQEIKDSTYYDHLAYGIVLTGGSAFLKNFDELFRRVTGMEVRVALPEAGFSEEAIQFLDDPSYATVTGLLLQGAKLGASSVLVERPQPVVEEVVEQPQPEAETPTSKPEEQVSEKTADASRLSQDASEQKPVEGMPQTPVEQSGGQILDQSVGQTLPNVSEQQATEGREREAEKIATPNPQEEQVSQQEQDADQTTDVEDDPKSTKRGRGLVSMLHKAIDRFNKSFAAPGEEDDNDKEEI